MTTTTQSAEQTDGFHLVIDALKLNGINTIYGLPGIPDDIRLVIQIEAVAQ